MSDAPVTFAFRAPGPYLNMNDRDWPPPVRWRRIKLWRTAAGQHARQVVGFCPTPAEMWVQVDVWDSRRRDPHNLYPTVKACLDGMVDAGCWPDDTPDYVHTNEPTFRVVPRGTDKCVTITLTERAA